ncbi:MAG: hypothetical protein LBJ96_02220 [Holosporaceae bacterium]|jgi:hypothetical protein|nr:hypothetical protein [Holosporaceae bacterium]
MKKLVITATAVLFGSSLFAMEKTSREKLDDYVSKWSEEFTASISAERTDGDWDEFSTEPFKAELLEEIGDDSPAREAFQFFHAHDFVGLWKHWEQNNNAMSQDNAVRFRDLLILAIPFINSKRSGKPFEKKITDLAGGEEKVRGYCTKYPQFSYEMFFCAMVDSDRNTKPHSEMLSQICERICHGISERSDWQLKEKEFDLMEIVGLREDVGISSSEDEED